MLKGGRTMLPDMVHSQDLNQQLSIEEVTSPPGGHLFDFCESELFLEKVGNSQGTSPSYENCGYKEDESPYISHQMRENEIKSPTPSFSIIFDDQLNNNNDIYYNNNGNTNNNIQSLGDHHMSQRWPPQPFPAAYEDECLPPYLRLRPSQPGCSFLPPNAGLMLGNEISNQDHLDFLTENIPRVFNSSNELQVLGSESQKVVHGGSSATPLASEISILDDPTFKVGKLSIEERKKKIHRYMKKRNERNFSKKIKYACRKTLADSRPRVRGRFAKNDELGEIAATTTASNHEEHLHGSCFFSSSIPDHQTKVVVKEEEDLESADIFAHISGVNSFKCNYPIQSWI